MKFLLSGLCFFFVFSSFGQQVNRNYHAVKKYTRKDGTHVQSHKRTDPNHTNRDNYTTRPNVNPHTGTRGYITPDNNQDNSWISRIGTKGSLGYVEPYSYNHIDDGGLTGEEILKQIKFDSDNYAKSYNAVSKGLRKAEEDWKNGGYDEWLKKEEEKWNIDRTFPDSWNTLEKEDGIKKTRNEHGFISYELVDISDYKVYEVDGSRTNRAIRYHDKYDYETRLFLEETLNNAGFDVGTVDGVFTKRTIEAIKEIQRTLNMSADGMFGEGTLKALVNY